MDNSNDDYDYRSIKIVRFVMKAVGIWSYKTSREELILKMISAYVVLSTSYGGMIILVGLLNYWGDWDTVNYNITAFMAMLLGLYKLLIFVYRRNVVIDVIAFSEINFWQVSYNDFGTAIMKECETRGLLLVTTFIICVTGTIACYSLTPIVENIGKNDDQRILMFEMWIGLDLTVTPYFEIAFFSEILSGLHIAICFCCFDNLMIILIIHGVGQLKILQNRIKILFDPYVHAKDMVINESTIDDTASTEIYNEFKSCVDQHKILISYFEKLESIFSFILLPQMIASSLLLCFTTFQLFLAHAHAGTSSNIIKNILFSFDTMGCFLQLLYFTWTCNEIIKESTGLADAAYQSSWYAVPNTEIGKSLKQGLQILMERVKRPCYLSAGKFCPMSLQVLTSILSTAASYFTLLRQMTEEVNE